MTQENAKRRKMFFETLDKSKIKYKKRKLTKQKYNEEMNRKIDWIDLNSIVVETIKEKENKYE